jgi:hypothetical protein
VIQPEDRNPPAPSPPEDLGDLLAQLPAIRLGRVRFTDGKLLFQKSGDLDTYNEHFNRIQAFAQRESAIVAQAAEHDAQALQDIAREAR